MSRGLSHAKSRQLYISLDVKLSNTVIVTRAKAKGVAKRAAMPWHVDINDPSMAYMTIIKIPTLFLLLFCFLLQQGIEHMIIFHDISFSSGLGDLEALSLLRDKKFCVDVCGGRYDPPEHFNANLK